MKVVVTGFEPFRKEKVNPSWEVCKRLAERERDNVTVTVEKLPVVYDEARRKAVELLSIHPDVVLHLGEAGGRTHISVERVAINCDEADIKDNKGTKRDGERIETRGEDGLFATIPIKEIVKALKKARIPAVISDSAGTFLCNHVFYGTLEHVRREGLPTRAGFIHLPYLPEQAVSKPGKASMGLDLMVEAVEIAIKTCASSTV